MAMSSPNSFLSISPTYVIRSFLNVSQDSFHIAMVPFAFNARLKNRAPIFAQPPARFVFVFQRVTVFIGNSVKAEDWFLGAPSAKSKSALRQSIVFFRLSEERFSYFRFSFYEAFTREARNDLGRPVKVNAFEGLRIKAFTGRFPRFAAVHQRTQVSVSVRS